MNGIVPCLWFDGAAEAEIDAAWAVLREGGRALAHGTALAARGIDPIHYSKVQTFRKKERTIMQRYTGIATIVLIAMVTILAGCQTRGQPSQGIEYFRFTYKIAHQQPNGWYRIPWRAQDGSCNGHVDMPQAQIIQWLQQRNPNMLDCVADYTVEVQKNRALGIVSVQVHGNPSTNRSDIQIRAGRAIVPGTFAEPTNMFLESIGPIAPGILSGFAELNFGTTGPIFTSDRGNDSFFEHELFTADLSAQRVAGTFRFLASHKNNLNDNRLIIVVDAGYLMNVD